MCNLLVVGSIPTRAAELIKIVNFWSFYFSVKWGHDLLGDRDRNYL